MKVPGFLWTALLALVPLLIEWLGGDYFAGQSWVPWAILVLGALVKVIEMLQADRQSRGGLEAAPAAGTTESRVRRFLLG